LITKLELKLKLVHQLVTNKSNYNTRPIITSSVEKVYLLHKYVCICACKKVIHILVTINENTDFTPAIFISKVANVNNISTNTERDVKNKKSS